MILSLISKFAKFYKERVSKHLQRKVYGDTLIIIGSPLSLRNFWDNPKGYVPAVDKFDTLDIGGTLLDAGAFYHVTGDNVLFI